MIDRSSALLVGMGRYADATLSDLPQVANNLRTLHTIWSDPVASPIGNTQCLHDPDRGQLSHQIHEQGVAGSDLFVVYIAGHAELIGTELHLLPPGARLRHLALEGLPLTTLLDSINRVGARQTVVILDCCYSGSVAREIHTRVEQNVAILTGGGADERLPTGAPDSCTPFTAALATVLRSGSTDAGALLDVRSLYDALVHTGVDPTPRLAAGGAGGSIPVYRNRAWRNGPSSAEHLSRLDARLTQLRADGAPADQVERAIRSLAFWRAEAGDSVAALSLYQQLPVRPAESLLDLIDAVRCAEAGSRSGEQEAIARLQRAASRLVARWPDHPESLFAADAAARAGRDGRIGDVEPPTG
jgi:hypothetical protein